MKLFLNPIMAALCFTRFNAVPEGGGAEPAAKTAYKVIKKVTLPLKSLKEHDIAHVRFDTAAQLGKKLKGDESKKEPAHLCMITDLDTGEEMQMIMPAVLRSTLEEEYPNAGYVGRCFEIEHLGKKAGRGKSAEGYNLFRLVEVEDPTKQAKAKK